MHRRLKFSHCQLLTPAVHTNPFSLSRELLGHSHLRASGFASWLCSIPVLTSQARMFGVCEAVCGIFVDDLVFVTLSLVLSSAHPCLLVALFSLFPFSKFPYLFLARSGGTSQQLAN